MNSIKSAVSNFVQDEEAATAAEYGLMAALIAGVIITAVTTLGTKVRGAFTTLNNGFGTK